MWDELAEDRFEQLDADEDGILSEEEKDNFLYGPAWETSIVPYANWGDSFNSLVQYQSKLAAAGKRLYMSFMYKDCWDIREGTPDASFTIHKINGKNATKGETTSLVADSTVTGKISATLTETNLHAGVYPSMVKSLKMVSVPENSYKNAADKISSKGTEVGLANTTVFSIKGAVESGTEVALISAVDITMDMSEFGEFELFKVSGTELDPVTYTESDGKITFRVPSTKSIYVLYHSATGGDGPNDSETGCGCGGALEAGIAITALFAAACAFILIGKRKSE